MNKGSYTWMVILILVSVSGLIALLFFLLENPLQMNQEMFSRIVNQSLIKAVQIYDLNQEIRTINLGNKTDTIKRRTEKAERKSENGERRREFRSPVSSLHSPFSGLRSPASGLRPIDIDRLKKDLEDALKQFGILNSFHYAIFLNDSVIKSDVIDANRYHWYKTTLFPNDILSRDLYLGICFPETHLWFSHNSLFKILSILLTLLICLTFYISLVNIIRQRRTSVMKTDFINHMTHEFKTPVTTIGLAIDSILSEEVIAQREQVEYYSRMIKEENKRLGELVEKLLQSAQSGRKELYFKFQDINIHDLINKAIEGISLQVGKRGGRIDKKFEASDPVIRSDPSHFTNLIYNLLDNANKYSPDSPEIIVSTTNDRKGVYISVEDKGIGIGKRLQSKIFNKFYRLSSDNINNIKGFGLGLSYIKAILKLNKGKIKVYSETGKGSRFVVFLPYSKK